MRDVKLSQPLLHLIGAAGCVLILGACYAFGVRPLGAEETQLRQRRDALSRFATAQQSVLARNKKLAAEARRLRTKVARHRGRFATGNHEDELLKTLSRIARKTGTKLLDFQPGGRDRLKDMQTSVVRISARGTYPAVVRFFAELQKSPQFRRITQVQMQPADRTSGRFDVRVEIHEFHAPAKVRGRMSEVGDRSSVSTLDSQLSTFNSQL